MSDEIAEIDAKVAAWISRQKIFFVATAPLNADGLVNCSPKGLDTFRVLGPRRVAYLDMPGSGIETVAHLKENGRIVLMMCAFDGPPAIYRFHGTGAVIEPHDDRFAGLLAQFPEQPACRSIIDIELNRISKSCGFGVPLYEHKAERPSLPNWIHSQSSETLAEYCRKNNAESLDGLAGIAPVRAPQGA